MSAVRRPLRFAAMLAIFLTAVGIGMQVRSPQRVDVSPASDRFWNSASVRGMAAEEFDSLEEMAKSADLVVVGRIPAVEKGREWVANPDYLDDPIFKEAAMARFADAPIAIEEVIGTPKQPLSGPTAPLELFLPNPWTLDELQASVPEERAVFFLRNKGPKDDPGRYRLTNDFQGVLRDVDGKVAVLGLDAGHFLEHLDGTDFEELLESLRSLLRS